MAKRGQAVRVQERVRKKPSRIKTLMTSLFEKLWKPKFIAAVAMLATIVAVGQKIDLRHMWPIESVKIEGEFNYLDKDALRVKALPEVNAGLLSVNLDEVRTALTDLPWVEDVSVKRQWPGELLIRVIEKQPVMYWGDEGLLSAKGKLFKPQQQVNIKLPVLRGPDGQHTVMLKEMARMQAWLLDTGLYIDEMQLDERRSWTLKLSNGMELRLGRHMMHERLNRFVAVYKQNLELKRAIKHVDMRYTNGFAVAWKEA